jgi:hypothetical protein
MRNHVSGVLPNAFEGLLRHAEHLRRRGYRESQRFEAIVANDATGMNEVFHGHRVFFLLIGWRDFGL